jgi:hypothetical protein
LQDAEDSCIIYNRRGNFQQTLKSRKSKARQSLLDKTERTRTDQWITNIMQ